jgi:PPOX class probable F420-dependent enzyme
MVSSVRRKAVETTSRGQGGGTGLQRPVSPQIATNTVVTREELLDFARPRHHAIVITARSDGSPQASPVTCGVDQAGRIVVATYPSRAKTRNARRDPRVSVIVLSETSAVPGCKLMATLRSLTCQRRWSRWSPTTGRSRANTQTGPSTGQPCCGRANRCCASHPDGGALSPPEASRPSWHDSKTAGGSAPARYRESHP